MNQELLLILGAILLPTLLTIVFLVIMLRRAKRLDSRNAKTVSKLVWAFAAVSLIASTLDVFSDFSPFTYLVRQLLLIPLYLIQNVAPMLIAFWLARIIFQPQRGSDDALPDPTDPAQLDKYVVGVLDSGRFLTALRSVLPKGKDDERLGLDYIPFMLHNVDERRRTFGRKATQFLAVTVALGIVFSIIVMYFGYTLVNEASAGPHKTLAEIERETRSIDTSLQSILPGFYRNAAFQQMSGGSLSTLEAVRPGPKNEPLGSRVKEAIDAAKQGGDLVALGEALRAARLAVSGDGREEVIYAAAVSRAHDDVLKFLSTRDAAIPNIITSLGELKRLLPTVSAALSTPEHRIPELIKRLAVGLVVATFFLAILRYASGLYRAYHHQMLKAITDDDAIRRFYVVYKSSAPSDEQRKAVLTSFISNTSQKAPEAAPADGDGALSKHDLDLVKELLAALSKKL